MCSNNDVQFDFSADFADSNYKSCFARSVAVNSQFHSKSLDFRQLQQRNNKGELLLSVCKSAVDRAAVEKELPVTPEVKLKKTEEPLRRLSTSSNSSSSASRRGSDLPVENLQLQSQVDLLHWQLKQAENSRQMYRAVMQQVVCFLERAHRSLDMLCEKQNSSQGVHRTRSEFHVADIQEGREDKDEELNGYRDFNWRKPKRQPQSPNEIPPDKLSQEAFRLLRTAQSLLNTREPDLAHVSSETPNKDQEFLSQLAKEFPSRPQRATSFSLNPQLISPADRDVRISTAFNRKLSLQRTPSLREKKLNEDSSDYCLMSANEKRGSFSSISLKKNCLDSTEKTTTGSVSSAEDESGFSSMNSFQEVGLPIVHSPVDDPGSDNVCDASINSTDSNVTVQNNADSSRNLDKSKLVWNRSEIILPVTHRRWSSTPVEVLQNDPLKVLWV